MSKYIVDTDDFEPLFDVDSIGVFGIGKSLSDSDKDHSWSRIKSIEEFEELNSDYINEHFGDLQDTAYQRGLEDGKKATWGLVADASNAEYQRGLDDAWEAARKIIRMPEGDLLNIFTECYSAVCTALQVLLKYDASEAIEKLKAYEEKQSDKIKLGDEVIYNGTTKCIVVRPEDDKRYASLIDSDGTHYSVEHCECKKTGRHFDIQSILEEMRHD